MASYNKKQDFEQWLSEHDPDSKKYKYRDKSAYSYIREQKETASIPRTREVERAYAENPAGWENSKNMQSASVVPRAEDYRAAAYAYSARGRQQKPIATSRNPRSSYYNPNWQKEINEREAQKRQAAQVAADNRAAEHTARIQQRSNAITSIMQRYASAPDFESGIEKGKALYSNTQGQSGEKTPSFMDIYSGALNPGSISPKTARGLVKQGERRQLDAMSEDEKNIYYYLLGTKGDAAANEFKSLLDDELNRRIGTAQAEQAEILGTAGVLPFVAGVESSYAGAAQALLAALGSEKTVPRSPYQYAYQAWRERIAQQENNKIGLRGIANDLGYTVGNMLPGMELSAAMGGLGAPSKLASALGSGSIGLSSGGNAYREGRDMGYSHNEAITYGALTGASEAGLQYLLGGVSKLGAGVTSGKVANVVSKALDKVVKNKAVADTVARYVADMGSEATEEYLQSVLEPVFRNIAAGENNDIDLLSDEALYSAMMGALTAGLFNAPEMASGINNARSTAVAEHLEPSNAQLKYFTPEEASDPRKSRSRMGAYAKEFGDVLNSTSPDPARMREMQDIVSEYNTLRAMNRVDAIEQAATQAAARASQARPPENIRQAASQAAENAAQSAIKPETKNNTTHTAKEPTTGVATNETAAQPEANQETDKAKIAATALDNITKAGAMNTPYGAVADAYKEMVSTGVITPRELSDAYATGLAEYNKSHADTTGDNEYATKIANALSTLNKYVDNDIKYTIRGNDNWGYTAAVTRIRDNNGGVPIKNARDTLFIMSGLRTRQDAVDALVGASQNLAPVGTTQETVSPTEAPKVERKPPNDAMIQMQESNGREQAKKAGVPAKTAQSGVATRHTATTSNGNAVSVGSIVETDNGLYVRLSDGTTAQLPDVEFDDPNINALYERAADFDVDTANALVNNYTGETSVDNYLRGFNSVYLSGKQGYEYAKAVGDSVYARHYLNDNARMAAFRAGQAAYQSSRANSIAGQQGNNVRPQAKAEYEAGVNREYSDRKLTSSQRKQIRALDEVFKAAGKKLVIHDAIGADGNSVTFSRSDANAYYDAKTDTYHLSLDSTGQAYAYVVAHESVHEMEVKNKEGFSALSEVVEAAIEGELMNQKGMTFDEAKAEFEKMVQYQMDKNGLNRSEAVTEVVANTVPAILTDEQQGKRFADKVMKSSGKVRAWFEQLIKDLRAILDKAYNILKGQKSWEQMELIRNNKQTLDMIADYYFEGMEGTKGKASNTEKTDGNVKRSTKNINADIREVNPMEITPPNRVTSSSKYHYLINEFENNGYNGRNVVLVENGNDGYQALTGSHRILAAREAGVDVPSVVIPMSEEIQPLLDATGDEERARIADELYEDGIIPKEVRDLLVREDELNFENLGKPLDKQVRFSRKDDVSVTSEDAKKLQKQNDKLKQALEVAKQEIKLSDGHHVKASAVERLAGSLLKEYSSKMDKAELVSNITELFDYIGNGENVVWDEVQAGAMNIALNVLDQSSKRNTEWYDNTKPAREFLKNNTIKLNEKQLAEVQSAFGSYTEFRRELYNKAKFSKTEGISLEQAWRALSGMFPDTFDPDTPDVDMPTLLHDEVLNMYDRPIENPYGYGMKEYAADLAMRLYGEYMALPERKTFADKQQKKLEMQRARYNTLMEQQREQAKAKYEKLRDQRDITKYKTSIEKNAKSLYSWLTKPNNSKHVPEALRNKTADLLKTLEFDGKKGYMWKDAMRNLQTWMQQVDRAKTNPDIDNPLIEYAPDLIDNMQSLLDSASKYNNISDMPLDKLKELNNIVAAVKHTVTTANTVIADGRRQYIDDIGGNIIKTAQVQRPKAREFMRKHPYAYKMASAVSGFFNSGNVKPIYFFDNIGGEMKTLFNDVRQASYKSALTANTIREEYAQIKDKYHYKEWADKKGDLLTIQTNGGSNVSITREQALDIYATAKREKLIGTQHLTKDGFVFNKDIVQKNGKLIETATNDNVNKPLSEETIAEISDWLTKEQKGYADALVELMSTKGAELGNEVTMQMYGINRFAESYYIPIMSARQFIETAFNGRVPEAMSWMNKGFTKNTVAGARNPIVITGITQKALQHMADMATYNAMAIPQDTMAKVYNYKQRGEDGGANTYIRAELDKAYGQHTSKYIKTFINDISGNITVDPRDSMASKMISAFRRNAVAGKLSVAIQQPSAIVRATALVDPKYFFGHVGKDTYDTAKKYSGTAVIKEVGGFDAYTGKGLVQWMADNDKLNFRNVRDAVAGWLPQKMDEITWCRIWKACENEIADTTAFERGSEEFYKAVGHRFDDVIEYTQVYDSVISRSEYMRSKSAGAKLFTSFKAEPTVSYNMYWYALKHMNEKGGKARLLRTAASIIGAGVFNAILKSVITAIRDDDENQNYVDKYVEALAGNLVGTPLKKVPYIGEYIYLGGELDTLGSLPLVNEVLSLLQGYTSSRSELKVIQDLINAAGDLDNENKGRDERWLRMAKATSQMFGIPLDAFIKDWLGVVKEAYKAISGNEPELSGNILYEIREGLGVKQELELYKGVDKAITTGDYTRLDKQFKTMVERDTTTDPTKKARETVRAAVRQYFDAGEVKAGDAKRILVRCGYKMDDAEAMITKWDFWRDYPEAHDTSVENNTEKLAEMYFEHAKPANIDKAVFYDVYKFMSKQGTKKEEAMAYINKQNLTKAQKDALYLCKYAESKIDEAPWR